MKQFQLYKKRRFGEIINDTFTFFRVTGKNYYTNFLKISGGFILIILLLFYLAADVFFKNLLSGMRTPTQQQMLSAYFDDNFGLFLVAGIVCALLLILVTAITYAYPVVYMRIMENGETPATPQLIKGLKSVFGRIVKFILFTFITFVPIAAILGVICVLLIAIIIGIPVAILVFSFLSCWMSLTFYDYLNNEHGYFTAMKNGYNLLFVNFWAHSGSTAIFYIMIYMAQSVVSVVFYVIGSLFVMMDSTPETLNSNFSSLGIIMLFSLLISIVLSYLLTNILMVNQGIIYYSSKEVNENNALKDEIDLIGAEIE